LAEEDAPMKAFGFNVVSTFVAIAQAGTMTAAAKELHLPTSTVSRSLTRLENHLGMLLVRWSPRGVVLNDAGKEYLHFCRRALRTLKEGSDLLDTQRSQPSGLIRVSCPVTMSRDLLAAVALPNIAGSISATSDEATWVLTSYLFANAIFIPASTWLSLKFGRKRYLITSVLVFTAASFACGSANSLMFILVARAIQVPAGGALQPLAQAILLESFPSGRPDRTNWPFAC
jgi:molybdenum-dependent DNA-binding transcriptional regulator ModE